MTLDRGASRQLGAGIDLARVTHGLPLHLADQSGRVARKAPRNTTTVKPTRIPGANPLQRSTEMTVNPMTTTDIRSHPGGRNTKAIPTTTDIEDPPGGTETRLLPTATTSTPRRATPTMRVMNDPRSRRGSTRTGGATGVKVEAAVAAAVRKTVDLLDLKTSNRCITWPKPNTSEALLPTPRP